MKNKSSNRGLPYFLPQRIHGKSSTPMSELRKPQLERTEIKLKTILHWENDGEKITDTAMAINWLD
jgi:hypothetical protein